MNWISSGWASWPKQVHFSVLLWRCRRLRQCHKRPLRRPLAPAPFCVSSINGPFSFSLTLLFGQNFNRKMFKDFESITNTPGSLTSLVFLLNFVCASPKSLYRNLFSSTLHLLAKSQILICFGWLHGWAGFLIDFKIKKFINNFG